MTTGLPAWVAICAVLTARPLPVHADGPAEPASFDDGLRQVAVVDLTDDLKVGELTGNLYRAITATPGLKTLGKRELDTSLSGRFPDEDSDHIAKAGNYLVQAQTNLEVEANAPIAVSSARLGQAELAQVVPTPKVQTTYAELSLVIGLALLDEGKPQDAIYPLGLVRRLEPARQLDPARYPPDSVAAFKRASEAKPATVTLEIKGTGHVWIDFVDRGTAPATFDIEVGEHCVTVSGADRLTAAVLPRSPQTSTTQSPTPVLALVKSNTTFDVPDLVADDTVKVQRLRAILRKAVAQRDDATRAGTIKQLADLLGVTDIVMLSMRADGQLQWETWRDRAPGFSAPQVFTTGQKVSDMLDVLAPPNRQEPQTRPSGPPQFVGPIIVEQQWYDQGWVQISGATGVILIVVGIILLSTRDHPINFGPDIKASD